jgi:hypothetical protein
MTVTPRGRYEPAVDSCDFGNLHPTVVCAGSTASVARLKADARNLVGIIGGDKTKTQTYCQITILSEQLDQEKDSKKAKALSQKIVQLQKKLGPEFVALVDGLKHVDQNSPDAHEIASIIESLDQSCD